VGNQDRKLRVTPQAIRPTAISLAKRGGPKVTTAIHGPLDPVFYPNEKANVIANYYKTYSRLTTCVTLTMNGG
jgi:hypothetical protein